MRRVCVRCRPWKAGLSVNAHERSRARRAPCRRRIRTCLGAPRPRPAAAARLGRRPGRRPPTGSHPGGRGRAPRARRRRRTGGADDGMGSGRPRTVAGGDAPCGRDLDRAPPDGRRAAWAAGGRAGGSHRMRRIRLSRLILAGVLLLAMAAPVAFGAVAPQPGQKINMKVLLLSADGKEATFGAWKAALDREGVPYDALVADASAPFTDATFADYGAGTAKYQAVILATGDLVHAVAGPGGTPTFPSALADSEWTALAKFEQTFGIRQISDATQPTPAHGLNFATSSGPQDGITGQLTAAGLQVFPYLKGPVPIDNASATDTEAFGYQATPAPQVAPASFQTLLGGPNGSSYLGVYTHADGREEMVMTVDSNEFGQTHNMLLRHGMLSWVTRGVFLGYQRNYFEMQVDDVFLPDDRWDPTLERTAVDGPTTAPDEVQCGVTGG